MQDASPVLACLGNQPVPPEVQRDLAWHLRWPEAALNELWAVLAPSLASTLDPRLESALGNFAKQHGVSEVELALFLKAMRHLLLACASHHTPWEDFAADLTALLGERSLSLASVLGASYAKAMDSVRFEIMRAALLDHGSLYVGSEWRLDAVLASGRAPSLHARVGVLTLKMRSRTSTEQLTLQVLPSDLPHLRRTIDELIDATEAHKPAP